MPDKETKKLILKAQRNEITEHFIYKNLAAKSPKNKKILEQILKDELKHYNFWKAYSKKDIKPNKLKVWLYYFIPKILGPAFGLKLMENGEDLAQKAYNKLSKTIPKVREIEKEEAEHERQLLRLIDDERLKYAGSIVLGLNDALVELTGAIAGLTLAFQNTGIVGIAALITGIAASFSMAASEYLSTKAEGNVKNPLKASIYTGITYIFTVLFLVIPYFLLANIFSALAFTLTNAVIVILVFTFYVSVAQEVSFKKRFLEMILLSFGVAALTFVIGFIIRTFLHIDI